MADVTSFQEAVLNPATRPRPAGRSRRQHVRNDQDEAPERPPRKGDKGKAKGKHKGKGKHNTWKKRQ